MVHKYLENNFAQLEHINQVIYNNQTYEYWEVFDTHYLINATGSTYGTYNSNDPKSSEITSNVVDVRYNSILVNINTSTYSNAYLYTFEVRNILWDGQYKITHSKNTDDDEDVLHTGTVQVSKLNENTIAVLINGDKHKDLRIALHLSNVGEGRKIAQNSIIIENSDKYSDEYNKSVSHEGKIVNEFGKAVSGANVSLRPCTKSGLETDGGLSEDLNVISDAEGLFSLNYSEVDTPGEYYVKLTATYGLITVEKIVTVDKYNNNIRGINWGDESQYKNVYKGCIKTFNISIIMFNKYGQYDEDNNLDEKLIGKRVTVTKFNPFTQKEEHQTCIIDNNNQIHPTISFRKYYDYKCILRVVMEKDNEYEYTSYEHEILLEYAVASDYANLKTLVEDTSGPDWIMLPAKTLTATSTINIKRDLTIMGLSGTNEALITGQSKYNPFYIQNDNPEKDAPTRFRLIGISLKKCAPAIKYTLGTSILVDRCIFINNINSNERYKGSSIYAVMNTSNINNPDLLELHVTRSYFYNNYGNEITSIGETYIDYNLFKTDNSTYLKQPEPKVVNVVSGEVHYNHNKSYINTGTTAMQSNHCYAKALTYVYKNAKFNGKGPAQLGRDNSLPLFGNPYYNEAYTYSIYYYPHGINSVIVCSPRKGYERRATGHASSKRNWVYYDGYYFIRRSGGLGNRYDPWSQEELSIPGNMGVYDNVIDKFLLIDYDPKVSTYNNNQNKIKADTW